MVYWFVVYADQSRSLQHKEPYYSTAKHNTWILNFFYFLTEKGYAHAQSRPDLYLVIVECS